MPEEGSRHEVRRRAIMMTAIAAPAVAAAGCTSSSGVPAARSSRFFTDHEAAVVEAATARIAPGPSDDPAEAGHPGAREADVTGYIDTMLSMFTETGTPKVFAGGPWSNRHTSGPDMMAMFLSIDPVTKIAWNKRVGGWQRQYRTGIASLDKLAGGNFTKVSAAKQDQVLAKVAVSSFLSLLFEHTIEGLYSNPEYGGNRDLAGWKDISYPGDSQPRGYTDDEVSRSDGPDPVGKTPIVAAALKFLGAV
ncbi:MAG TPA: gluconate 2-dehydrogenase subunit 3 family protein [Streptosporangiaceae bacterium]